MTHLPQISKRTFVSFFMAILLCNILLSIPVRADFIDNHVKDNMIPDDAADPMAGFSGMIENVQNAVPELPDLPSAPCMSRIAVGVAVAPAVTPLGSAAIMSPCFISQDQDNPDKVKAKTQNVDSGYTASDLRAHGYNGLKDKCIAKNIKLLCAVDDSSSCAYRQERNCLNMAANVCNEAGLKGLSYGCPALPPAVEIDQEGGGAGQDYVDTSEKEGQAAPVVGKVDNTKCGRAGQPACPPEDACKANPQAQGCTVDQEATNNNAMNTAAADQLVQQCLSTFSDTQKCCGSPLSCMGLDQNTQQQLAGGANVGGNAVGQMFNSGDAQSMQQACNVMKNAGYSSAGINAAGASLCNDHKNSCVDVCDGARTKLRQMIQAQCGYDPERTAGGCALQKSYTLVNSRQGSCLSFSANIAAMGQQASHSYTSAQMSAKCEQMASNTNPSGMPDLSGMMGKGNTDTGSVDCSDPRYAQTSACGGGGGQYGSGSQTDDGDGSGPQGNPTAFAQGANFGDRPDAFNTGVGGNAGNQQDVQIPTGLAGATAASSSGVPGNSGGFNGGSGSGPSGGGGRGGATGSGGSGYNTDVLRGVGGGGGYSNPAGGNRANANNRGGLNFGGMANGGNQNGKPIDLKQFLPGGKSDPGRKIAGIARGVSEIGPRHSNIWHSVSNKMRELCNLNVLYDCGRGK